MGDQKGDYGFATGALPQGDLRLLGFWGVEEISRLSRFELLVRHDPGPLSGEQIDALFKAPCGVAMGPEKEDIVRGVVTRVRSVGVGRYVKGQGSESEAAAHYIITMAPTASLLTLGRNSRVFQDLTIPEIAAAILAQYGLMPEADYKIRVDARAKRREFVVQYQESDWDFLQRWFEREGYFSWFEHDAHGDVLVIADDNGVAPLIEEIYHSGERDGGRAEVTTLWDLALDQRRVPSRVIVMDYNDRAPERRIIGRTSVDVERGFGAVISYGEHVDNEDEAVATAKLRADRYRAEQRTFTATIDGAGVRAGSRFKLLDHPERHFQQRYLATKIEHRGGAAVPGTPHDGDYIVYEGRLSLLAESVPFRPERLTPWPRIHGFTHGHIAGDSDGTFAEMDKDGCYWVKLTFDTAGTSGRSSSPPIRMAQPYAGSYEGRHQPLRKGTEVMIVFLDGDPDRPVIAAAVPNVRTPSPTTEDNATQAVTTTPSGIRIEVEDNAVRRDP